MSQVTVTLDKELDKVVGIIKSAYGISSKDKAIQFIIRDKADEILERELKPEFIAEMRHLEKTAKFKEYKSMDDFWDEIENG